MQAPLPPTGCSTQDRCGLFFFQTRPERSARPPPRARTSSRGSGGSARGCMNGNPERARRALPPCPRGRRPAACKRGAPRLFALLPPGRRLPQARRPAAAGKVGGRVRSSRPTPRLRAGYIVSRSGARRAKRLSGGGSATRKPRRKSRPPAPRGEPHPLHSEPEPHAGTLGEPPPRRAPSPRALRRRSRLGHRPAGGEGDSGRGA